MKYILNNDNLEVIGKQYLQGVGDYDGTNIGSATDLATFINNNKYVLPKATSDTLGGINALSTYIGTVITDSNWKNNIIKNIEHNIISNNGKLYGIHIGDNSNRNIAFVHVPYATNDNPGIVNIGSGITADNNGNIQLGKDVEWINIGSATNMNDFTDSGIYNLFGEHTRNDDNLPINNTGGGHTFSGRLSVFDSSLPNIGSDIKDCCLTQLLTLSNRVGGDGNMYIRNGSGLNKENLSWSNWGKLQTNVEIGLLHIKELDNYIDNGIYSGVSFSCNKNVIKYDDAYFVYAQYNPTIGIYFYSYAFGNNKYENKVICAEGEDPFVSFTNLTLRTSEGTLISSIDYNDCKFLSINDLNIDGNDSNSEFVINLETFVLININNYVAASSTSTTSKCSQLKYSIDTDGNIKLNQRSGEKIYNEYESEWHWKFNSKWDNVSSTENIYINSIITEYTIKPNKFYIWDEVSSLTITLEPEIPNVVNEYMFQFTSGDTATTLSLPSYIKWVNDEIPIIEPNYIYQISILNGLGSIMKFKK